MKSFRKLLLTIPLILILTLVGCGHDHAGNDDAGASAAPDAAGSIWSEHYTGSMELEYADQFHVDFYEDGIAVANIEDGLRYLILRDGAEFPDWLESKDAEGMTVIHAPVQSVYNAASSAMDLIDAAGGIDSVIMTSTQAQDWGIEKIGDLVRHGKIQYIGKYRAPDYEALLESGVDLAIESTMIYHNPDVKEAIEDLGIPVLVERSSYESDPLGRLEWIKLYGLLMGRSEAASEFFDDATARLENIDTDAVTEPPAAAFFSVNSSGSVTVRKPGDYVTRMIEMAGGTYALDGITDEEDNALSTMNMQMEAFYDKAMDADILIYNSTIEGALDGMDDLTALSDKFADFDAVKSGNVWCTSASMFQKTTGIADMIVEMNEIFSGTADDSSMKYFYRLDQDE